MDRLHTGSGAANRPIFAFQAAGIIEGALYLIESPIPLGQLTLTGPAEKLDEAHWPVRGDLAHIALAGQCFVPHYAVPMPHVVGAGGAALHRLADEGAEVLAVLAAGALFDVLDMSGGWCWGQMGNGGFVGYVRAGQVSAVV